MKKIIISLAIIVVFAGGSFAAIGSISAISVDVGNAALNTGGVTYGLPSVRFAMSKNMNLDVGLTYVQTDNNNSDMIIFGRINNRLFNINKNAYVFWGGKILADIDKTAGASNTFLGFSGSVGAEAVLLPNLAVYSIVDIISLVTGNNNTAFGIFSGSTTAYSGLTLYL